MCVCVCLCTLACVYQDAAALTVTRREWNSSFRVSNEGKLKQRGQTLAECFLHGKPEPRAIPERVCGLLQRAHLKHPLQPKEWPGTRATHNLNQDHGTTHISAMLATGSAGSSDISVSPHCRAEMATYLPSHLSQMTQQIPANLSTNFVMFN